MQTPRSSRRDLLKWLGTPLSTIEIACDGEPRQDTILVRNERARAATS